MDISTSRFTRWMIDQLRAVGWDTDHPDVRAGILTLAAMATTDGLTPEHTATIARAFAVTPDEVTAAYTDDLREHTMADLLAQPGLSTLDARLDRIAADHPQED